MLSKSIRSANDSATIIASNEDLVTQILVRLPIKSLLRFKCVSKHWLSLISDPNFSRGINHDLSVSGLFLQIPSVLDNPEFEFVPLDNNSSSTNPPFKSLTFVHDSAGIIILQSCNGLLLCCSYQAEEHTRNYYVYNPTTNNFTTLPKLRREPSVNNVFSVVLAFDPSKSPHYKAICVRRYKLSRYRYQYRIDIFSSETRSWRPSSFEVPFEYNRFFEYNRGVFCNGVIHWKSSTQNALLSFELKEEEEEERMQNVAGPENIGTLSFEIQEIQESRGILHVFGSFQNLDDQYPYCSGEYGVYEMEKDYSGWIMKYRFDFDAMVASYPLMKRSWGPLYSYSVFSIVVAENDEDSFLVLHIPGKVMRYNLNDKSFKVLRELDQKSYYINENALMFQSDDVFQFIQVLASV